MVHGAEGYNSDAANATAVKFVSFHRPELQQIIDNHGVEPSESTAWMSASVSCLRSVQDSSTQEK